MKERRIACLTYHKFPGEAWSDDEFQVGKVKLASGEVVEMALAERGTFVGNELWVREVRKKKKGGGQTSIRVVNPDYRKLDGQVRRKAAILSRKLAEFGGMNLIEEIAPEKVEQYQRITTERHITVAQFPEEQRFSRLSTQTKHFIDTVKMLAYRAETSMVHKIREQTGS